MFASEWTERVLAHRGTALPFSPAAIALDTPGFDWQIRRWPLSLVSRTGWRRSNGHGTRPRSRWLSMCPAQ